MTLKAVKEEFSKLVDKDGYVIKNVLYKQICSIFSLEQSSNINYYKFLNIIVKIYIQKYDDKNLCWLLKEVI